MSDMQRQPVVLRPDEGRRYTMGRMTAVFKADEAETAHRYSISEWWLEPDTQGPGAHAHDEDDVFFVIEGTMDVLVAGEWIACPPGSSVLVPGGAMHDFRNSSRARAGVLNFSVPGGFEAHMPSIVDWFARTPPGSVGDSTPP